MPRSDRGDWRAWLALAWACVFGVAYAAMIVERRGASLMARWPEIVAKLSPSGR